MTDVKNFKFDEFDKVKYLHYKDTTLEERWSEKMDIWDKNSNVAKCNLCYILFDRPLVQNIITKRMLYKLNANLTKRGVFLLNHLNKY
jgi:hypothetical protein